MVADVHRVMMEGGVYGYPGTLKAPEGKIRLLYEANPMSMLVRRGVGIGIDVCYGTFRRDGLCL